ncbi:hypothetical protein MMC10_003954 [Thelotrema lepadinum]|nr:hypothetical protein [Thelotrema lepadinum]
MLCNLEWLWPVFITAADVPNKFIDAILSANAELLRHPEMNSAFALEIIHSKSGVEAQLAGHRATLPFLEGTKPPVTFPPVDLEDSFFGATIEKLTAFVVQKLRPRAKDVFPPDYLPNAHFFIIDAKTLHEGSMILIQIHDANLDEDSESDVSEDSDEGTQRFRLAGEKVELKFGKQSLTKAHLLGQQGGVENRETKGKFKINAVRIARASNSSVQWTSPQLQALFTNPSNATSSNASGPAATASSTNNLPPAPMTSANAPTPAPTSSINNSVIAGIAVGGAVLLALIAAVVWYFSPRRFRRSAQRAHFNSPTSPGRSLSHQHRTRLGVYPSLRNSRAIQPHGVQEMSDTQLFSELVDGDARFSSIELEGEPGRRTRR